MHNNIFTKEQLQNIKELQPPTKCELCGEKILLIPTLMIPIEIFEKKPDERPTFHTFCMSCEKINLFHCDAWYFS